MKNKLIVSVLMIGLSGCGPLQRMRGVPDVSGVAHNNASNAAGQVHPRSRPSGLVGGLVGSIATVPEQARTVEDFDTTTAVQRAEAEATGRTTGRTTGGTARALGETVASLGDPTQPGFWLKTPLVNAPVKGRVTSAETGKSVQLELLPIAGAETAGSRISLAALRLLGLPLTALPTLEVFAQ